MKHSRISRRRVQNLCDLFNYRFLWFQELGNRKNYYYLYTIIDDNGNVVVNKTSLKKAHEAMVDKCKEYLKAQEEK